jgi:hypothetical protein
MTKKAHYNIRPASIAYVDPNTLYGKSASIVGWGLLDNGHFPDLLITATVTIMSKDICNGRSLQINSMAPILDDRYLCSSNHPYALINYVSISIFKVNV